MSEIRGGLYYSAEGGKHAGRGYKKRGEKRGIDDWLGFQRTLSVKTLSHAAQLGRGKSGKGNAKRAT